MPFDQSNGGVKVLQGLQRPVSKIATQWRFSFAIYFIVLCLSVAIQVCMGIALFCYGYTSYKRRQRLNRVGICREPLSCLVPVYLPNEVDIIKDTIRHLLHEITHVEQLDIYIVYNTPHSMSMEEELQEWADSPDLPQGRRLFVVKVPGSRSKAENLNYVIPTIETECVAIYDADHHPHPRSLALAVEHLHKKGMDCVQGSTYIREGTRLLRHLINGEFFVQYFVILPVMCKLAGTAFFGGSNGIWRTESLKKAHPFDKEMLTEDIDCFARSYVSHRLRFDLLPECRSGELAPAGVRALWKQRIRWAVGWDQVAVRRFPMLRHVQLPMRRWVGLYVLFLLRHTMLICGFILLVYNTWNAAYSLARTEEEVRKDDTPVAIVVVQRIGFAVFLFTVVFALGQVYMHDRNCHMLFCVGLYTLSMPVYMIFNMTLVIVSMCRLCRGHTGSWEVTQRSTSQRSLLSHESSDYDRPVNDQAAAVTKARQWPRVVLQLLLVPLLVEAMVIGGQALLLHAVRLPYVQRHPVEVLRSWSTFSAGVAVPTVADGQLAALGLKRPR